MLSLTRLAPTPHPRRPAPRGFTLYELVIVMVILGIISTIAAPMIKAGLDAYLLGKDLSRADAQARLALERITRDLHLARSNTAADLPSWTANAITFVNTAGQTITYSLSGTQLMRNAQPLADGISGLNITYIRRDVSNLPPSSPAEVYYISVKFNVTRSGVASEVRTTLHPRNYL